MVGGTLDLWNHWATQILLLLSLALQVVLFVFAGIRRRETSGVPRILLWLAYLLADSTAIYAIGHLSLSSAAREHICKRAIVDSSVDGDPEFQDTTKMLGKISIIWGLMEMELSLMYDILYTKAAVVHTWFGYCVRVISPLAIMASLLLFQFSTC